MVLVITAATRPPGRVLETECATRRRLAPSYHDLHRDDAIAHAGRGTAGDITVVAATVASKAASSTSSMAKAYEQLVVPVFLFFWGTDDLDDGIGARVCVLRGGGGVIGQKSGGLG